MVKRAMENKITSVMIVVDKIQTIERAGQWDLQSRYSRISGVN